MFIEVDPIDLRAIFRIITENELRKEHSERIVDALEDVAKRRSSKSSTRDAALPAIIMQEMTRLRESIKAPVNGKIQSRLSVGRISHLINKTEKRLIDRFYKKTDELADTLSKLHGGIRNIF